MKEVKTLVVDTDLSDIIICGLRYALYTHNDIFKDTIYYIISNRKKILNKRNCMILLRDCRERLRQESFRGSEETMLRALIKHLEESKFDEKGNLIEE